MTDNLVLFEYRLNQAEITLSDAKKMLDESVSNHSIVKPVIMIYFLDFGMKFQK
jgi:hypothetical protein